MLYHIEVAALGAAALRTQLVNNANTDFIGQLTGTFIPQRVVITGSTMSSTAGEGIHMNGYEYIGIFFIGHITTGLQFFDICSLGPLLGNFDIGTACHIYFRALLNQQAFEFISHTQGNAFIRDPRGADGAGITAAMPGVKDNLAPLQPRNTGKFTIHIILIVRFLCFLFRRRLFNRFRWSRFNGLRFVFGRL